jgi:hypothetical protein
VSELKSVENCAASAVGCGIGPKRANAPATGKAIKDVRNIRPFSFAFLGIECIFLEKLLINAGSGRNVH